MYACFGQGDIPGLLVHIDDNIQWESWFGNSAQKAGVPWMQLRKGKAGVLDFFKELNGKVKISVFQVLSIMLGENQVAVEFYTEAEIIASGKAYRDEEMHLWTFNESGKVTRLRHYLDTHKHIEAAKS